MENFFKYVMEHRQVAIAFFIGMIVGGVLGRLG